jgi:predicted MFS family arabinose efflux permease
MKSGEFAQRVATRLAFLVAGMGMSVWAALVPFAKTRMQLQPGALGLLLLCLGLGSLTAMPVTGILASRFACRPVILCSGAIACAALPFLASVQSPIALAVTLFVFGASIGTLDVAMNIQAVLIEKAQAIALMSGFHGFFSVGGFLGAGVMSLLLWAGMTAVTSCVVVISVMGVTLYVAAPHLLRSPGVAENDGALFAVPRGAVILIGALCFILFLAEGAVLDWGGILLTTQGEFTAAQGGLGYAAFAIAMTVGRLSGDRVVRAWGGSRVLVLGGIAAAAGFFIAVLAPVPWIELLGFLLIGIGASNIVPILFTAAGRQHDMPVSMAISAITTIGYAGILAGPPIVGFIAQTTSLRCGFGMLGCALLLVAVSSRNIQ